MFAAGKPHQELFGQLKNNFTWNLPIHSGFFHQNWLVYVTA
jgi:hypothetical protein